jgi:hypothetical protein
MNLDGMSERLRHFGVFLIASRPYLGSLSERYSISKGIFYQTRARLRILKEMGVSGSAL